MDLTDVSTHYSFLCTETLCKSSSRLTILILSSWAINLHVRVLPQVIGNSLSLLSPRIMKVGFSSLNQSVCMSLHISQCACCIFYFKFFRILVKSMDSDVYSYEYMEKFTYMQIKGPRDEICSLFNTITSLSFHLFIILLG